MQHKAGVCRAIRGNPKSTEDCSYLGRNYIDVTDAVTALLITHLLTHCSQSSVGSMKPRRVFPSEFSW